MKIGVDVDDVLCDTMRLFLKFIMGEKGINKNFDDVKSYNLKKNFGFELEESNMLYKKMLDEFQIDLISGAADSVKKLHENHDIIFITSRQLIHKEKTESFLKTYFIDNPIVYFSSDYNSDQGRNKEEICRELGIGVIIEDNDEHSLRYAQNGICVLLLDKPWNKNIFHENIVRCNGWEEVLNQVEKIVGRGGLGNDVVQKNKWDVEEYFRKLKADVDKEYLVSNRARKIGLDPVDEVECPLAITMAEKSVNLIKMVYPDLPVDKISERIIELENQYGQLDSMVSFCIAREIAEEKFCKFKSRVESIDCGVRIGFAYITLGVVSSPIEGFTGLRLGETKNGEDYFIANFSGPIRSAGTTAICVCLMLIDFLREHFGYAKYDPNEQEIKRYVVENYDYHERVNNLQYLPTEEEIEFLARNMPIEISGEPSEKKEVSNFRDLPRIDTNFIRGGMCLAFSEGLAQKAAKGLKRIESVKKHGLVCSGWDFLSEYLEIHKKREAGNEYVEATYIKDLVAGRPVYGYPGVSGGFRFRFGRSRTSGFSAVSVHPATMGITNGFLSIGTQLKLEKPTKGCIITLCDSIDGPIVKLKNGTVKRIESYEESVQICDEVEEIIYLGDILFPLSDVIDRNAELPKVGYVEEWWGLEVEKKAGKKLKYISKVSLEDAIELSREFAVPLHPKYIFYWSQIKFDEFLSLLDWLKDGEVSQNKIVLPYSDNGGYKIAKRALEILGVEHERVLDKIIIEKDFRPLMTNIGVDVFDNNFKKEIEAKKMRVKPNVLDSLNDLSEFLIKDKAGSFIGARMGRPEKAKLRKLPGSPNSLFFISEQGGRLRTIQEAANKGYIESIFPIFRCRCGNETIYPICEKCGEKTKKEFFCKKCNKMGGNECEKNHAESLFGFSKRKIDSRYYFDDARKLLSHDYHEIPPLIKGIKGGNSLGFDVEHLAKGILRAKFNLSVNRDGTIRYDGTEIPITHFKPIEIGVTIDKLKELGYNKDIYDVELTRGDQILEIKPHDVILPSCPETRDERADDVFFNIGNFIDEELKRFYKMDGYYNFRAKSDLVGQLIVVMAPHNCAGVVGRIIGFSKMQGIVASPYMHAAVRRDCDGDECTVMMLMDVLLNFSRKFLPSHRGGTQDAPLVLNARIFAGEVDDQILNFEVCGKYPLEVYELAERGAHSRECKIETVRDRLRKKENPFVGIGFTHETSDINSGVLNGAYKILPTMSEKVRGQMELAKKIRAVDCDDVARLVLERHFIRDIRGNLRKFSRQQFRCSNCNEKYRRPPLAGVCLRCKGKIIFTISEGSIKKYLEPAMILAKDYKISDYTREVLELTKMYIESIFGKEERQEKL
ncbi:MAG: DNA polymerase II large subunit [Candidatus Pacearchaeota archaeon]